MDCSPEAEAAFHRVVVEGKACWVALGKATEHQAAVAGSRRLLRGLLHRAELQHKGWQPAVVVGRRRKGWPEVPQPPAHRHRD